MTKKSICNPGDTWPQSCSRLSSRLLRRYDCKAVQVTMKGTPGQPVKNFNRKRQGGARYNIAIVVKSQAIPVWESHLIAAAKAGQALGVNVLQYAPSKADNVEEQKRILEDLVTKGVDCVVFGAGQFPGGPGPGRFSGQEGNPGGV